MENYEELYNTICRVCLNINNSKNVVSLTDTTSEDGLSPYGNSVLIFSNISLQKDSLPDKMCNKCLSLLKQAIIFKKTCESSHEKLKKFGEKFDVRNSDFKEKLCDFVMFLNSYPEECAKKKSEKHSKTKKPKRSSNSIEVFVKTEENEDINFESDFDDLFQDNFNYEENLQVTSMTEEDILDVDSFLDKMETVAEMNPKDRQINTKRYPKIKLKNYRLQKLRRKKAQAKRDTVQVQCKICLKVLSNQQSYQAHILRHTSGQYICEQCGRNFVTNAELQYHLASSHDIGRQHTCKECGFKAPKRHELMEHERIHTGERPYACDKCGLTFRRRYIWKKHSLYHMEKTVQCPQCPKKFHQKGEMQAHINSVHERMYIYACSHCDITYAKTSTVRRHMTEKHGIARGLQGKIKRINLGRPNTCNGVTGQIRINTQNIV